MTVLLSTGGQAFYPKDVSEVDKIAHELAHVLRLDRAGGAQGERDCDAFAEAFLGE